jgi:hypothetical protein
VDAKGEITVAPLTEGRHMDLEFIGHGSSQAADAYRRPPVNEERAGGYHQNFIL